MWDWIIGFILLVVVLSGLLALIFKLFYDLGTEFDIWRDEY